MQHIDNIQLLLKSLQIEESSRKNLGNFNSKRFHNAFRRAGIILRHVQKNKSPEYQIPGCSPVSGLEMVPMPGTFQYGQWVNTLKNNSSSSAFQALLSWEKDFLGGNPLLSSGLRRIRIIQGHMLADVSESNRIIYVE